MNLIKEKLLSDKKISEESLIPWKSVILTWLTKNINLNPILFWKKLCYKPSWGTPKKVFDVPIDQISRNVAILSKRYCGEATLKK